ncbi:MAG TPA: hypothetical protein VIY49_21900, partial [Bryobacteraceae bacterium]
CPEAEKTARGHNRTPHTKLGRTLHGTAGSTLQRKAKPETGFFSSLLGLICRQLLRQPNDHRQPMGRGCLSDGAAMGFLRKLKP